MGIKINFRPRGLSDSWEDTSLASPKLDLASLFTLRFQILVVGA